ncbi:MAG: hypothetical protein ACI81P_003702, partial [Neolewinella sp.]
MPTGLQSKSGCRESWVRLPDVPLRGSTFGNGTDQEHQEVVVAG